MTKNQFSLTRAALSAGRPAKGRFLLTVILMVLVLSWCPAASAGPLTVISATFTATMTMGDLSSLVDGSGNAFVTNTAADPGVLIHWVDGDRRAMAEQGPASVGPGERVERTFTSFDGVAGSLAKCAYEVLPGGGDLVITQSCTSPLPGVWGVEWGIANIPLEMNVIVPGQSGIKLTSNMGPWTFDYPQQWEAQMVVVEGVGRGFYVWAEDAEGRYKRLSVNRQANGWRLGFATINYAPFDALTNCASVRWHLNVYEGDWRVPAKRYRDWAEANLRPVLLQDQQPAWVKDIRCCIIMGLSVPNLEALTNHFDPAQTLLFVPDWRQAGFDHDYPTYDQPFPEMLPFIQRAHALGFRVMLHVNHFGCDPLNPLYAQFEPFQVRSPWGNHEKEWWTMDYGSGIEPVNIAYINPAYTPWRELFVARMVELCTNYSVDALQLDQTLVIENDHNGLIGGLSMLQGNLALHRELRAALPQVALGGEGLNEVTYRYESFAQRHAFIGVWIEFHGGWQSKWKRAGLQISHPISSYLLRPYTIMYGFLGMAAPSEGQPYAAWQEAYQHWGVIPTVKLVAPLDITDAFAEQFMYEDGGGFLRQFLEETQFWQTRRLDLDLESPWPQEVAFPFKTASGERVIRTADRALMCGTNEISRTITGVTEAPLPGTIPSWWQYDEQRIVGLEPQQWYPCFLPPRNTNALSAAQMPAGFYVAGLAERTNLAFVMIRHEPPVVFDLTDLIYEATCGSRAFTGGVYEVKGPVAAPDGAQFGAWASSSILYAQPPYNGRLGVAYARYKLTMPRDGSLRFTAAVAMDSSAVGPGKTDGVIYGVSVESTNREAHAEKWSATSDLQELSLDMTSFAGQEVTLELSVHPGTNQAPWWDSARWYEPRVEQNVPPDSVKTNLVFASTNQWTRSLFGEDAASVEALSGRYIAPAIMPGDFFLVRDVPPMVQLPLNLSTATFQARFLINTDLLVDRFDSPPWVIPGPFTGSVGGVTRSGLWAQPPNQGQTIMDFVLNLPPQPVEFHSFIGIIEGCSDGTVFVIQANGKEIARKEILPGAWQEIIGDLYPWAGKPVVLSLITDSDGWYNCDWAWWGEPQVRPSLRLGLPLRLPDGTLRLPFTGEVGRNYVIQSSTNLVAWTDIVDGIITNGTMQATDTNWANSPFMFYRALTR